MIPPALPESDERQDHNMPLLAPLSIGDRLPWRLVDGEPTWLIVTAVLGPGVHEVEYPDGSREILLDSE